MFSWFLKLLGIDEDRPTSSSNSYLDAAPTASLKEPAAKAGTLAEEPVPEAENTAAPQIEAAPAPEAAAPEAEKSRNEPASAEPETAESEKKPAPAAEPPAQSLLDAFPSLKANYAKVLEEAGFTSKELIDKADDKELLALKGIGKATLKILRG